MGAVLVVLLLLLSGVQADSAELLPVSPQATTESGRPVVRFILFYGETCPHCHEVMDNYLPSVYEKYGDQVEYQYLEVWSSTDNYLTMLGLETKLGVSQDRQGSVPALVIGDKVMIGSREIPEQLEGTIDDYLAQGGVDYPSLENLPKVVPPTPAPVVQVVIFLDPGHPDADALNSLMASLGQQYGEGLRPYAVDISQSENQARMAELNRALGVDEPASGTPEVLIDRRLLVGLAEIQAELPGLVEQYLAQGGVVVPSWDELVSGGTSVTSTPPTPTPEPQPIYLAFFEQAGCQECARTSLDLNVVREQYPQVVVESFSAEEKENLLLHECLSQQYQVSEEEALTTPMIFVGQDVLIGPEAVLENLLATVGKYAATGAERTWADCNLEDAQQNMIGRFNRWGVLAILGAGLIDGLNPCAFATLVFFISYLTFTGRRGRDILFVGLAFTVGVFLTYLLVGLGLFRAVQSLDFFPALGRWVYLLTALLCVVLAALTFADFLKAQRGQATDMTLKLPLNLRRRINKVIRENAQTRSFVAMAFVTGIVVSLIELACTGQVYLPTIVYVLSVPGLAAKAFLYLLLYCLLFILPLIVVFALSYFGTTSEQLGQFVGRHTSTIKFATGLVFVGLALWMTWTLAPLFRVENPWTWGLLAGEVVVIAVSVVLLYVRNQRAAPKKPTRRKRKRSRA